MLEEGGNARSSGLGFFCCGAGKVLVQGGVKKMEPLIKMLPANGQMNVFLKGVAAIRLITQQHGRPEVDHDGQMVRPVDVTKYRRQQGILRNPRIKSADQLLYLLS